MNWISIAKKLLGNIVEHEKAKEFKEEFIGATIDWLKPFFLEEIPEDEIETASEEEVDTSIQNLLSQEGFQEELEKFVETSKEKNLVVDVTFNVGKGNIKIGHGSSKSDVENEVKGNNFDVGEGDIIIGG